MKENNDPHQVVMSVEVYNDLLRYAEAGVRDIGGDLYKSLRHIRRFNASLRQERQDEVTAEQRQWREDRAATVALLNEYTGKEVYYVYTPAKIIKAKILGQGRSYPARDGQHEDRQSGKLCIRIELFNEHKQFREEVTVHHTRLLTELPEGFHFSTTENAFVQVR